MTGNGIPQLYVVRADGEQIYGNAGSLSGDDLPRMLIASLQQSGRAFSPQELNVLHQALDIADAALQKNEILRAAVALSEVVKIGSPDDLGSYAKPALRAAEIYGRIKKEVDIQIEAARTEISSESSEILMPALVRLHEGESIYTLFPKWKPEAVAVTRELKKNHLYPEKSEQAKSLVKARVLAASLTPRLRNRAKSAYATLIRRFPNSEIDSLARNELRAIDPDAKVLNMPLEMPVDTITKFRTWSAKFGNFQVDAKFLQQKSGKVQLQKRDGTKIVVDVASLSESDRDYLLSQP